MGNKRTNSSIVPAISQETASKRIPQRLCLTWTKRATFKIQCFLSEPDSAPSLMLDMPFINKYSLIFYDGPNTECPVLATVKGTGKWKQDFAITLPSLPEAGIYGGRELLRCNTFADMKERYWFGMLVGEDRHVERFEWRRSHCAEVKNMGGASWGWKLVRLADAPEEMGGNATVSTGLSPQGVAGDGHEIVAVWADEKSWSLIKIGEIRLLGSGATGEFGLLWELMVVISCVSIWSRHI